MPKSPFLKYFFLATALLGGWILIRYALPVLLPFLLGAGLALAAEPMVSLLTRRVKLPRWLAAGLGVTAVFILLIALLVMLIALLVREAGQLSGIMPDLVSSVQTGMGSLESWLLTMSNAAPDGIRTVISSAVTGFFSGGSAMMQQVTQRLLGLATGILSRLTDGALGFATGILSAFMISGKLPQIKTYLHSRVPPVWRERYIPALKGLKEALLGWLTAQLKLTGITLALLFAGFWALQIPYAPVWAFVISLVDALPVLGTGAVLIPWSVICLLQGDQLRGIGLLGIYVLVWLTRSVLEPKLLGKELGLDPLVTLIAVYAGYKLFGLVGMILAPLLAVAVTRFVKAFSTKQ